MIISRRKLLTTATATIASATLVNSASKARAQSYGVQDGVRRDVSLLAADDPIVSAYRDAVQQMRALPASNPLSWEHHAAVHLNYCPHGNWFFLPWHRAYLHQFEELIRKFSGNEEFYLPYWDWTQNPQIPPIFWGSGNPLSHPRNANQTTSIPAEFVGEPIIKEIMETTGFEDFASFKSSAPFNGTGGGSAQLEGSPHNQVHVTIGQDMVTFMSPRDPVFWLHHCNIDRIWASWNGASNVNTNDPDLADFMFTASQLDRSGNVNVSQFVTRDGSARDYTVRDMYTTTQLGYVYDRLEPAPRSNLLAAVRSLSFQRIKRSTVQANITRTAAAGVALSTALAVKTEQTEAIANFGRAKQLSRDGAVHLAAPAKVTQAMLLLKGLKAPEDSRTSIRVFLNCDYLSLATPLNDPHYVGSAAFFLAGGHDSEQAHGAAFAFDIIETIEKLRRIGKNPTSLEPQVIAVNPDGTGAELEIDGAFEIRLRTIG